MQIGLNLTQINDNVGLNQTQINDNVGGFEPDTDK